MKNSLLKLYFNRAALIIIFLCLISSGFFCIADAQTVATPDATYTKNADFDKGIMVNTTYDEVPDQLQLNKTAKPFPFINIAASARGTLIRIDVNTGAIIGEYYTAPNGMGRNPSRTTVDLYGNVWVSNRNESGYSPAGSNTRKGSVTRIGLIIGGSRVNQDGTPNPTGQFLAPPFQYNTCVDRNNDGLIKTSRTRGNILPWSNTGGANTHGGVSTADDECIINYTRTSATNARTVAVDSNNDVWVGGANMAHSKFDGQTGQPIPGTQFNLGCGGYGGLIDKNGVLWSARYGSGLLRFDTKTMTGKCIGSGMGNYGLGIDPVTGNIWHSTYGGSSGFVAKIAPNGTLLGKYNQGNSASQGVAVDAAGNVWVANSSGSSTVAHLKTDGTYVGKLSVGSGPTGVAVDSNGKVWATNINSNNTVRINPNSGSIGGGGFNIGAVDLTVSLGSGAGPYNYSDMTGFVSIGTTSLQGYWQIVQDSGEEGNKWGTIYWNNEFTDSQPDGTEIIVQARAADVETSLNNAQYATITNAKPFLIIGRYIEVRVTLKANQSGESPVLTDIRIMKAPINNIRVIDTIQTQNNVLVINSINPVPDNITTNDGNTYIEWSYDNFSIGQIENLSFDVTLQNPVSGEKRLVNHKLEVLYTDINGNPVRTELGPLYVRVLDSAFESSIATDKLSYQANEDVIITAGITSKSGYARTIDAKILIEDSQGTLVAQAANLPDLNFAAGETKSFENIIFNTGSTYTGNYRAHLILYDNQTKVGEALTNFTIGQPTGSASVSSNITTDKMSYNANEAVTITSSIQNTASNVILNNLTAQITVIGSGGISLFSETKTIPILTPGQITQLKTYWNSGITPAGSYTVRLDVLDGANLLTNSMAGFTIQGTDVSPKLPGIQGTITATPISVYQGKDVSLGYTITNNGNADIPVLNIKIIVIDPITEEIKAEFDNQQEIPQGNSIIGIGLNSVTTSSWIPGTYIAILRAATPAMTEFATLSKANFEVKAGIQATKSIPDAANLLVWVNKNCKMPKDNKNIGANCVIDHGKDCMRIDLLEKALKAAAVNYLIVYDKDDFQKQLRNPYFTDYMILGDHHPMTDHFADELREHVYSGKGLISSLFIRDGEPGTELLGIKFKGHLPSNNHEVDFVNSPISPDGELKAEGKALKSEILDGATVGGWIRPIGYPRFKHHKCLPKCEEEHNPAVVLNNYGNGKTVFYAFDLGATLDDANYSQIAALIKNSIVHVHKPLDNASSFMPGQFVSVEIKIQSLGGSFDLKIKETYPAQLKIYDPSTNNWVKDNPWLKDIAIDSNETKYLRFYVLTPDTPGTYKLETEIGYFENGAYKVYGNLSIDITVGKDKTVMVNDIIDALKALPVTAKDKLEVYKAINHIENVKQLNRYGSSKIAFEKNIHEILKAIDEIIDITSCNTLEVRIMMDMLLRFYEAKFYFS